jgi:hypothetical protein
LLCEGTGSTSENFEHINDFGIAEHFADNFRDPSGIINW